MLRAGLVLLMMTVAIAILPAHAECVGDKQKIRLRDGTIFSVVIRKLDYGDGNFHNRGADISIFAGSHQPVCPKPLYHEEIEVSQGTHAEALDTPWFHGVDITIKENGDDGQWYDHRILHYAGGKLIDVTPKEGVGSDSLGGFYFGRLGHDRGNGMAGWMHSWNSDGDTGSFRFAASLYRWRGTSFQLIERKESDRKYAPGAAPSEFLELPKK